MTKRLSFFLFAALISVAPSAPPELIELKERMDVEKVAVLKPLYTSYLKALKRLETTYTQAGDLDNALEVRKEYESAAQQLASLKKITVKNGNAEATTSVGLYQTKLVSGSPWSFDFLDGGLIWFDKEGKLLIRDVLMREAYGTYKIEGEVPPNRWTRLDRSDITRYRPCQREQRTTRRSSETEPLTY